MRSSPSSTTRTGKTTSAIVDTTVLYAYTDRTDHGHVRCIEFLDSFPGTLLVPTLILGETAYLLGKRRGAAAEIVFLNSVVGGELIVEQPTQKDLARIAELVWRYRDLPLGTADASVVALAERLDVKTIATLDRRDFSVVRPRHVEAFKLVP